MIENQCARLTIKEAFKIGGNDDPYSHETNQTDAYFEIRRPKNAVAKLWSRCEWIQGTHKPPLPNNQNKKYEDRSNKPTSK
ncbi:MAG: hypothetical protein AAFR75_00300 [Pseudomonadota bacterium]